MVLFRYAALNEMKRLNLDWRKTDNIASLAAIGGFAGGKAGFVLEITPDLLRGESPVTLTEAVLSPGGLVFYGGFSGALLLIFLYLKFTDQPVVRTFDALMPAAALAYAAGRMGCMVSGDGCYGHASHVSIPLFTYVSGPRAILPTYGTEVWNTPFMEALVSFSLFLYWKYSPVPESGQTVRLWLFLAVNGGIRFLTEFLRLNEPLIAVLPPPVYPEHPDPGALFRYHHWYGFTQSQIFGAVISLTGLTMLWVNRVRPDRPDGQPPGI